MKRYKTFSVNMHGIELYWCVEGAHCTAVFKVDVTANYPEQGTGYNMHMCEIGVHSDLDYGTPMNACTFRPKGTCSYDESGCCADTLRIKWENRDYKDDVIWEELDEWVKQHDGTTTQK